MNRSVMGRQMFAKGGAAFPDLSGDGQITQKDILMGRGVVGMAEGGSPISDEEYFARAGLSKADYEGLSSQDQMRLVNNPETEAYRRRAMDPRFAISDLQTRDKDMSEMIAEQLAQTMPPETVTEVPVQDEMNAAMQEMQDVQARGQIMALQDRAQAYGMPLEEYISILQSNPSFAEQELNAGLPVMGMAAGGVTPDPAMMPPPGGMMAPPPGDMMPPPGDAMAPPPGGEFDPAVFQGMLETAQTQFQGVDAAAENEDFGAMMNAIRGDEAPVEARYEELAEMVGPEDAQQTPESVLTLLQPVMQMAAVDQGIGGLAQDEMMAPVEGPMAEGIMSTVNMAPPGGPAPAGPDPMAMAAPGGAAPVNFRQGGAVQYFNPENDNRVVKSLRPRLRSELITEEPVIQSDGLDQNGGIGGRRGDIFREQQALFQSLRGDQSAAFEEQKNMTKAQMLFDIAQGALAFATPGETQMSPAERLAQVAQPVLGNIGARSGELLKFKQAQDKENQSLDMAALTESGQLYSNELASAAATEAAKVKALNESITDKQTFTVTITGKDGKKTTTTRGVTVGEQQKLFEKFGMDNVSIVPTVAAAKIGKPINFVLNGVVITASENSPQALALQKRGFNVTGNVDRFEPRKQFTLSKGIVINGTSFAVGSSPFLTTSQQDLILNSPGNADALLAYQPPVTDKDYFTKYGRTQESFMKLDKNTRDFLQGLPVITDQNYWNKFQMTKLEFHALPTYTKNRLLGVGPEYEFKTVKTQNKTQILRINKNAEAGSDAAKPVEIFSEEGMMPADLMQATMLDANGVMRTTIIDLNLASGRAALREIEAQNEKIPSSAGLKKISTASSVSKAFLIPGGAPGGGNSIRMSFDGGATYIGSDGLPRQLPTNAVALNDTQTYDIYKTEKIRSNATQWLTENDAKDVLNMSFEYKGPEGTSQQNGDGLVITKAQQKEVKDTLAQIRAGTGPWSSIFAAINAIGGGLLGMSESFSKAFAGTEEGRQFTRMVYVMGRSALASSPRFAVGDLKTTGTLFPNPDDFMSNPVSEANKFKNLAVSLKAEQIRMQKALSDGTVAGPLRDTYFTKLNEIDRLQRLMGPVQAMSNNVSDSDLVVGGDVMNSKVRNPIKREVVLPEVNSSTLMETSLRPPRRPSLLTSKRPQTRSTIQGN